MNNQIKVEMNWGKDMTDKEIERMIEGDKDYSDLSMLAIPLPMIIFVIVMIIKFV